VVHGADAPWVLVERAGLREQLAPFGIVVRDCSSFGMAGTCRIAVPSEVGLDALAHALDQLANE
jgi:histidinol-phosphate/aromatic aminotransferase/cobyric acid decarboxylase-like protein